jgi:transketolase
MAEKGDGIDAHTLARLEKRILDAVLAAGAGHPGGSLSAVGILGEILLDQGRFRPEDLVQDWFVLAKGHAAPALYSVLVELGWFDEPELATYKHLGSRLQGHPDRRKLPGVQVTTGHLGQGLSVAVGLALAERRAGSDRHVWAVLGDGDLHEGQTWEALMSASHYGLGNLTAVVDANGLSQHGTVSSVMSTEPVAERLRAFGWTVAEVDGHDPASVSTALAEARAADGPAAIVARTVKGHGVSFMEGDPLWHSRALDAEEHAAALAEIDARAGAA